MALPFFEWLYLASDRPDFDVSDLPDLADLREVDGYGPDPATNR